MHKKEKINSCERIKLSIFAAVYEEAPLHIRHIDVLTYYHKWGGSFHYPLLLFGMPDGATLLHVRLFGM